MAGKIDPSLPGASYEAPYVNYRSAVSAVDATLENVPEIDLTKTVSARGNSIAVVLVRTVGVGAATFKLFGKLDGSLASTWLENATIASTTPGEVVVQDLRAGIYKLQCVAIDAATTFAVHISKSQTAATPLI